MVKKVSLSMSEAVLESLDARARLERRSRSAMADLLLEQALASGAFVIDSQFPTPASDLAAKFRPDPR